MFNGACNIILGGMYEWVSVFYSLKKYVTTTLCQLFVQGFKIFKIMLGF